MLLFSLTQIKPYAGKTKLVLKVWMEFKFSFSDFLLAQFKAGLHFCDMTLLQRYWNLILVSPSVDPNLVPVYNSRSPTGHQLRGSKARAMQVLWGHPRKGDVAQPTIPSCRWLHKEAKHRNELFWKSHWISQELWNESLLIVQECFPLIEESEILKHDQTKMHCKVQNKISWILNKICLAYKDLKFFLIANKVWIIIKKLT